MMAACAPAATPQIVEVEKEVPIEKIVKETVVVEKVVEAVSGISPNQAPMLQAQVQTGDLPPLSERLPKEPFVVKPGTLMPADQLDVTKIGKYGGTMRLVHDSPSSSVSMVASSTQPLLRAPSLDYQPLIGNLVRDYEISDDLKVFTFYMREGLKYSDGVPVTSEDVRFSYEDVVSNEEITPSFPSQLKSAGKPDGAPMKLEIIDDYTFRLTSELPYGGFAYANNGNTWRGYARWMLRPRHHLEKYHIKYTPMEELAPLIKERGLEENEWYKLFNDKDCRAGNGAKWVSADFVDYPGLEPWVLKGITSESTITAERNPYFFKVDMEGNQLPYIDKCRDVLVQGGEMAVMEIIKGNVDHSYEYGSLADYPLLKENEAKGNYKVMLYDMHRTTADVIPNYTNPDPVWRELIRDVRFKRALCYAMNYDEIIEVVYYGNAGLPVTTPSEFDPDEANKILDEMGMDARDGDGFRLGPDGNTFVFKMDTDAWFREFVPTGELVREYYQDVGIKTDLKTIEPSLLGERRNANELYSSIRYTIIPYLWWMFSGTGSWEAPLWKQWFDTNGEKGEKPDQWWLDLKTLAVDQLAVAPEEHPAVIKEMEKIAYDNILWMVTCDWSKYIVCMGGDMGGYSSHGYGTMAQHSAEFFFFDR